MSDKKERETKRRGKRIRLKERDMFLLLQE